jgi:hypothetical protein
MAQRYSRQMIGSALLFGCGNGCAMSCWRHGSLFVALILTVRDVVQATEF